MQVAGVGDGVRGVDIGGACPRSVSTCTGCYNIFPELVGVVLDMGADPRASLLSQVFFQCPGAYLLWKVLKWAGGEGRGVQNVYKGIGLDGGWGCWEVGWLEWKLMGCF